jgi:hypothetical protein
MNNKTNKIMKWSELPQGYKDLRKRFYDNDYENIGSRFTWSETEEEKEGNNFWSMCAGAETIDELPPLPETEATESTKTESTKTELHIQDIIYLALLVQADMSGDDEKNQDKVDILHAFSESIISFGESLRN